jgi:opacity protein-like surface antigen
MRSLVFVLSLFAFAPTVFASVELGINYAYKKSSFDSNNNSESQSTTGSVSFYFWERVALEMSYTNSLYVKKEKQPDFAGAFQRTTTQNTDVYGADLIFVLADRKDMFQPYLKGGVAQVKVKQMVQDDNNNPWEINYSGISPSYGIGFKFFLTQAFAIRTSYDAIETPTTDNTKVTELNGRVGVSWIF